LLLLLPTLTATQEIAVGTKKFTESYVLGNAARILMEQEGYDVDLREGMGGTQILWDALRTGEIDVYPEYTGTIVETILKGDSDMTMDDIREEMADVGIGVSEPLGFNNTYALIMQPEQAERLGVEAISDLADHTDLRVGVNAEFLNRADGFRAMMRHYGFQMDNVRVVDHSIAYSALRSDQLDLKEAYSTDAEVAEYDLMVLEDDRNFFPEYEAVWLYRLDDVPEGAVEQLRTMEGMVPDAFMSQINLLARENDSYSTAAAEMVSVVEQTRARIEAGEEVDPQEDMISAVTVEDDMMARIWKRVGEHLVLVGVSMGLAIIVSVPLGIVAARPGLLGNSILGLTGILQTVPSLALLAVLVPYLGIGVQPAIVALFVYSLLPIVRNTAAGLQNITPSVRESAAALGLEPGAQLTKVYLPIASRTILAGIKTSLVINIGTATLAALVGAGGLGQPILSGIDLMEVNRVLEGLIPASLLALVGTYLFELLDRVIIPRGLRLEQRS
jgi:osmoprotectant transport system permease protein